MTITGKPIGVGIIGYQPGRSWSATAHVPALKSLPEYAITAVATTRPDSARVAAADIGLPDDRAFSSAVALATCQEVDVVAVTVKVPQHLEVVRAAVAAGKHVYCEWPLGNGLDEAIDMMKLLSGSGLEGVIGLQARCAPPILYLREIIASGEIGEVVASNMFGTGLQWGDWVDEANTYLLDPAHGATLLTIPFGHAVDAMSFCLGEFAVLSAEMAIRQPQVIQRENGRLWDKRTPDQVAVVGTLENGAFSSIHYRGGTSRGINFAWEINGTKGDIRLEAAGGHIQMFDLSMRGGFGKDRHLTTLDIPTKFRWVPQEIGEIALNVAQVYRNLSRALSGHGSTGLSFDLAVNRHRVLAAIEAAAASGERVHVNR